MTPHDVPVAATRRRARWSWLIVLLAFVAGVALVLALTPYLQRWGAAGPTAAPEAAIPAAAIAAPTAVPATLDALAVREAAIDVQLRTIEGRLAAVDAAARGSAGNAARGEAMLTAAAVRRVLDRGMPLGELEAPLRQRFEAADPAAVRAIVTAARSPVTREDLRIALDGIAPQLLGETLQAGIGPAIGRAIANLAVLRRATTPSPRPADRLARVRRLIDIGNVEAALAEVARLPGAAAASGWTDAARSYVDARRGIERLELAALAGRAAPAATPPLVVVAAPVAAAPADPAPDAPPPATPAPTQ